MIVMYNELIETEEDGSMMKIVETITFSISSCFFKIEKNYPGSDLYVHYRRI
jgi:hypothetical protein